MICFHSFPFGSLYLKIKWAKNNITIPATANRTCAITKGWPASSPIFVAEEADAHKMENAIPAAIQVYSFLIDCFLNKK